MKILTMEWKKMLTDLLDGKGFVPGLYKECVQLKNKRTT